MKKESNDFVIQLFFETEYLAIFCRINVRIRIEEKKLKKESNLKRKLFVKI